MSGMHHFMKHPLISPTIPAEKMTADSSQCRSNSIAADATIARHDRRSVIFSHRPSDRYPEHSFFPAIVQPHRQQHDACCATSAPHIAHSTSTVSPCLEYLFAGFGRFLIALLPVPAGLREHVRIVPHPMGRWHTRKTDLTE